MTDERLAKAGWLTKEGRIHHNWKKRWFEIRGHELQYYTATHRKYKGAVNLETCVVSLSKDRKDKRSCLELLTEGRKLYFEALTPEEQDDWLVALNSKTSAIQYGRKARMMGGKPNLVVMQFFDDVNMNELTLSRDPLMFEAVASMAEPLKFHRTLRRLSLRDADVEDVLVAILSDAIATNISLKTLDLSHNRIGVKGADNLGKALMKNKKLEELMLSHNEIGDKGVEAIVEGLRQHPMLRTLTLDGNGVGDKGVATLCEALVDVSLNIAISVLALSKNRITSVGAESIAKLISRSTRMTDVLLAENSLGNDGAALVADALLQSTSVRVVDLSTNDIGLSGAESLAKVISSPSSLEVLLLGGSKFSEYAVFVLMNAGRERPEFRLIIPEFVLAK